MSTGFFVGSTFQGLSFNTENDLLILIRDKLTSVGWVVVLDDISANSVLKLQGKDEDDNNDKCYFIFQKNANNNVEIKGYLGDSVDANEESPPYILEMTPGTDNALWLTADSGSACIMVLDGQIGLTVKNNVYLFRENGLNAFHFGFLKRIALYDKYAWAIGTLDYSYHYAHMARRFSGLKEAWLRIGDDYSNADDYTSMYLRVPVTTFDPLAYNCRYGGYEEDEGNDNRNDPLPVLNRGTVNGVNGLPYLGTFYYIEGRKDDNDNDDYGGFPKVKSLYCRGNIKFAATGLASLLALEIYQDVFSNFWISTNNYGAQGMQIG